MKRICCLVLAVWLLCSAAGAENPRLVPVACPVTMPAEAEGEALVPKAFIGISPDGKTLVTWTAEEVPLTEEELAEADSAKTSKAVYHICLVRDGEIVPVADNLDFGAGDPYRLLDKVKKSVINFPGVNGLSWSEDGRYMTLSDIRNALSVRAPSMCLPVIDTVSREAWIADVRNVDRKSEDYGTICLGAVSRNGRYVYYLSSGRENGAEVLCFCRCATADGSREILCEAPLRDAMGYQPDEVSNLVEAADGSWLLSGINGTGNNRMNGISLIRFVPSGDRWTASVLPTMIPRGISAARFVYSHVSGYGLMVAGSMSSALAATLTAQDAVVRSSAPTAYMSRVNLIRFHPDEGTLYDVWYMRRTGDTPEDMEMAPGWDCLAFLQALVFFNFSALPPEGCSPEEEIRNPTPRILNVCMSPDGRQALLAVKTNLPGDDDRSIAFYLLDPETMEVRYVETPEGTGGMNLAAGSAFSRAYQPGFEWNPDGTIVIHKDDGTIGFFSLAEE